MLEHEFNGDEYLDVGMKSEAMDALIFHFEQLHFPLPSGHIAALDFHVQRCPSLCDLWYRITLQTSRSSGPVKLKVVVRGLSVFVWFPFGSQPGHRRNVFLN